MLVQRAPELLAERAKEKRHGYSLMQEQLMTKKDEGETYIFPGEHRVIKLGLQQHWEELELTRNRRNKRRAAKSKDIKNGPEIQILHGQEEGSKIRQMGQIKE